MNPEDFFDNMARQPQIRRSLTAQEMEDFCAMLKTDVQCMAMTLAENWKIVQQAKKEIAELDSQWAQPAYEKK